jgi:ribosome assembly protein YihI (activator of Der GTPase)
MRTIEQTIYKYAELDDSAKLTAREWFSQGGYVWIDEGIDSIRAFCDLFGVKLEDYSLSPYSHSYIKTDAENHHFRGLTLKEVESNRSLELTGYCLDCDLLETMADSMKATGCALSAFRDAIEAGKRGIINDMEWQDGEEYISEMMEANGYEFDEYGRRT